MDGNACPPPKPAIMDACAGSYTYNGLGSSYLFQDDIDGIRSLYGAGLGYVLDFQGVMHVYGTQGNDNFAISTSGNNITVSNQNGSFSRSPDGISNIHVHGMGGNDYFRVYGTAGANVTLFGDGGNDRFIINGNAGSSVNVFAGEDQDGNDQDHVTVNMNSISASLTDSSFYSGQTSVFYNVFGQTEKFDIVGNYRSNLTISHTPSLEVNVQYVGTVGVQRLANTLNLTGARNVFLGPEGTMAGITGRVQIQDSPYLSLRIDDSRGTTSRRITLQHDNVSWGFFGSTLSWSNDVRFRDFTILGGSGGNDIEVNGTPDVPVTIDSGSGADTIIVRGTTNMPFDVRQQDVAIVTMNTGLGRDQVLIQRTNVPLRVHDAGGGDEIWVGRITEFNPNRDEYSLFSLKNKYAVDQIFQTVHVTSGDMLTTLNVVDTGSTTNRNIELNVAGRKGLITGLTPTYVVGGGGFRFRFVTTAISYDDRNLVNLNIYGGSGGNTFDVFDTMVNGRGAGGLGQEIATTSLFTGIGSDTVNVHGTTGALVIDTQGSINYVTVGTPDSALRRFGLDKIRGDVAVHGGIGGLTTLVINDRQGSLSRPFVLYDIGLDFGSGAMITVDNLFDIALLGGIYGNSFIIDGTPDVSDLFSGVDLYTGAGSDSVFVKRTTEILSVNFEAGFQATVDVGAGNLDDIQGLVRISGPANGIRAFSLSDIENSNVRESELHPGGVSWNSAQRIYYDAGWTPSSLSWNGGSADDVISLSGGGLGKYQTLVNAGPGNDYVFVTGRDGLLANLGVFLINENQGIDSVFIDDTLETTDRTYTIDKAIFTSVSTTGTTVNLSSGVDLIAVSGGSGNNTYDVKTLPGDLIIEIVGGMGNETLVGPNVNAEWQIIADDGRHAIVNPATANFGVAFSRVENLQAGSGDDRFVFEPDAVPIVGNIDGGEGVNTLDYSAFTDNVYVNLPEKQATFVGGEATRFQNVIGGSGNDILLGNGGTLSGGAGRDLLIAGALAGFLDGGGDDDILIAGTTNYDANRAQLEAIRNFWARTDLDYASRVANLQAGAGAPALNFATINSNDGADTLSGNDGLDWFFASFDDVLTDIMDDEFLVVL